MSYPSKFTPIPNKDDLIHAYKGRSIKDLPTPSIIINKNKFEINCNKMLENAANLGADFRAHIKTHKSIEGTILQLGTAKYKTDKIVVSTMMEAWKVLPLVEKGLINDIHFSLPVVKSRLSELADFSKSVPHLRLMLDHADQLDLLAEFSRVNPGTKKWSVFIKIDMGTHRAGLEIGSKALDQTLYKAIVDNSITEHVEIYGFYCHAGHSYNSDSKETAKQCLINEIVHGNKAALMAKKLNPKLDFFVSVGATPTAHVSEILTLEDLKENLEGDELIGKLELHAGCYPCCDLQQLSIGYISQPDISLYLIAEVISTYPNRGNSSPGEQLINVGVLGLGREFGPVIGHGKVVEQKGYGDWVVGRISQEHGILTPLNDTNNNKFIPHGTQVKIMPQHACITAAAHPWFYIVNDDDIVIDIWIPMRGW
ncbi:putative serine dehydratase domain-containing protein [Scheffersomyces amazonensis]|uniref:putative serine dehydratase domain-containing protein n=1 Tax=Scheffersomyces amazonensis TaxID=1078765 RepID=UPI00315D325B